MKLAAFIVVYSFALGCIGFSVTTLLGVHTSFSIALVPVGVALANRVGQGFGVRVFSREDDAAVGHEKDSHNG